MKTTKIRELIKVYEEEIKKIENTMTETDGSRFDSYVGLKIGYERVIKDLKKMLVEEMEGVKVRPCTTFAGTRNGNYKLGRYYLVKSWFRNSYSWVINTTGETYYTMSEEVLARKNGEVICSVSSCKAGKEKLKELYVMEV